MAQDPNWDEIFGGAAGGDDADRANDATPAAETEVAPLSRRELRERERNQDAGRASGESDTASVATKTSPPVQPPKRKRRLGWLWALLAVILVAAAGTAWVWSNYEEQIREVMGWQIPPADYDGEGEDETTIVIHDGDTGNDIATTLLEADVTASYDAFYDLLLSQEPAAQFYPGNYLLATKMSAQAALDALQDPERRILQKALIQEGKSMSQVLDILSAATDIPLADFEAAAADPASFGAPADAPSLEGYLFPATYTFEPGTDARTVLQTLVNRALQSLDAAGVAPDDRYRVLTIASLIQREAGSNADDFYKVSRVIQNRLDQGMKLQFDSTAHYGYVFKHGEREAGSVFSSSDELNDDNPYNTYVHAGLPLGPIGAPGDLAIKAALQPADGSWLYFVTVNLDTGETAFSTTNAEHNAAVKKLQQWCRDSDSANCD